MPKQAKSYKKKQSAKSWEQRKKDIEERVRKSLIANFKAWQKRQLKKNGAVPAVRVRNAAKAARAAKAKSTSKKYSNYMRHRSQF